MNFSISKNDKPDELPSGGCTESRHHIIRQVANLLHRGANQFGNAIKDAHRYNRAHSQTVLLTAQKHNNMLRD